MKIDPRPPAAWSVDRHSGLPYRLADHEADEQSDLRLHQVAWALPLHPEPEGVTVFFPPGAEPHSIQE